MLARHPGAIFVCALISFAGAALIGSLVYAGLTLDAYLRSDSYFGSTQRLYLLHFYLRAALGALAYMLGRGAISWIALQDSHGAPATWSSAMRAALRRWRPLLLSSLVYGVLISAGVYGITMVLRELRLDLSNFRWLRSNDSASILTAVGVNGLALLPPDPGSPFSELYAALRYSLSRLGGTTFYAWQIAGQQSNLSADTRALGIASIAGLFATEALLCMRSAAVMCGDGKVLSWVRPAVAPALAQFWYVLALRWAVRLLMAAVMIVGLALPMLLHQGVLLPILARELRSYWTYSINIALYNSAAAVVAMLLVAAQVVYEARLFAQLREK